MGETARLVSPGDAAALSSALVDLLDHPAEATALGTRAQARYVAMFTPEHEVGGMLALYRKVLSAR